MTTPEEIERRVEEADTARTAKRSAAAKQVGELAQRRTTAADQLADIERELGEVLVDASDVIDVDELARFTNVPASELNQWLLNRKSIRTKRKRTAGSGLGTKNETNQGPSAATPPTTGQPPTLHEPAAPRADSTSALVRGATEVA
ncbi:hypothetical protein [Kutzneria albida]|uniref:Uncharacterized protein n=1 Tax=Kutzneria albida DSM 43870 TaxID=1449976 RepID=W5WD77_9PSEU|nr:hypothetical protein [Kutzneria albida]AHH98541.1 hypothetical protein KALB_5179 [Kutzneria albida DSM 43870]